MLALNHVFFVLPVFSLPPLVTLVSWVVLLSINIFLLHSDSSFFYILKNCELCWLPALLFMKIWFSIHIIQTNVRWSVRWRILSLSLTACISWFSTRRRSTMCFASGMGPRTEGSCWESWVVQRCPRTPTALSTLSACSLPQTSSPASRASLCSSLVSRQDDGRKGGSEVKEMLNGLNGWLVTGCRERPCRLGIER